jgi:hypothetical protein
MLYATIDIILTILSCARNIIDFEPLVAVDGYHASQTINLWSSMIEQRVGTLRAGGFI